MTKRNSVIDFLDTGQQSIQTQDGTKYVGAWNDAKMHGEGELRGEGGMYYKGMFDMGTMHGNGKLKTPTGTYEGEFKANKMHGKGTFSGKHESEGEHLLRGEKVHRRARCLPSSQARKLLHPQPAV